MIKSTKIAYDVDSIKKYSFTSEKIPRLSVNDPEVLKRMESSLPVIIENSDLVQPALKWNLGYLQKHLGSGDFYVYVSKDNRFKYFDYKRANAFKEYYNPVKRVEVSFSEFIDMLKERRNSKDKIYLQQTLNNTVKKEILNDYLNFDWSLVERYKTALDWGPLTSNLLLIGLEGNITPVHYDEQENLFTQLIGHKRCLLFSPDQFECLYPHPVAHPCDRQSQVDFENPDFERFPKFRDAHCHEAIVGPGDVLYIPMYWWHQIESLRSLDPPIHGFPSSTTSDSEAGCSSQSSVPPVTTSLNFWYRSAPLPDRLEYPLTAQQKVSVMRNVEKLLASALGGANEVGKLLRMMVDSRYDDSD